MLKIGNILLDDFPVLLAPMEDYTDPAFRYLCKKFGADMVYTEFISSEGLIRNGEKSVKKLDVFDYERPVGIQLYGNVPESMAEATKMAEQSLPDIIDINLGCPVKKIAQRGAGAGLLKDIPLMKEIARRVVESTKLPITVKTRLGWDESNKNIEEIVDHLAETGISAITIHGRTRTQMYKGQADWNLIKKVKEKPGLSIPVIGNGDIVSPQKAKYCFEHYKVDGIMIGRAAVGKPWIFRDVKQYLKSGKIPDPPTVKEKSSIAKEHFLRALEWKEEKRGIFEMRKHFSNYFKGLPNFKEKRMKLLTSTIKDEIIEILDEISQTYHDMVIPAYHFWGELEEY